MLIITSSLSMGVEVGTAGHYAGEYSGYILLDVERNGEAWYAYPATGKRYFLGRPSDALEVMKKLGLGAKHTFIAGNTVFPQRLSGLILLDVERNGEAYYIYPGDLKKYYLGRPSDAFTVMRKLGRGISSPGLANIPDGDPDERPVVIRPLSKVELSVPFTSQAPSGNWKDQRLQDGCEESTALMAVAWARGEKLETVSTERKIIEISDFLQKKYGEYRDISSQDAIEWIYKDYFGFEKAVFREGITVEDIVAELVKGNLVVTPMNGQVMHNPYYTPPGPPRHMIVIRGYDPDNQEFITNDPGTRHGERFRYKADVLFEAIRDYPTGYHEEIYAIEKNMIVISK